MYYFKNNNSFIDKISKKGVNFMADELKNRSIRIDEDTFSKFKEIASENFANQNECLNELVKVYELDQGKKLLPDRKAEIENFEACLVQIQNAFIHSLEMNHNAELRVRGEFESQLEEKDLKLQSEVDKSTSYFEELKSLKEAFGKIKAENENLDLKNKGLNESLKVCREEMDSNEKKYQKEMLEKQDVINALKQTNKRDQADIESLKAQIEANKNKVAEFEKLQEENNSLKVEKQNLESQVSSLKESHKKELQNLEKQYELDKKQAVLEKQEALNNKIEEYREDNSNLKDRVRELEKELDNKKLELQEIEAKLSKASENKTVNKKGK